MKLTIDTEEVESKCAEFTQMPSDKLFAVIASLVYNSVSDEMEITSKKRFAYAYALSRSYIEFGAFDFELIPKWVIEFLIREEQSNVQ